MELEWAGVRRYVHHDLEAGHHDLMHVHRSAKVGGNVGILVAQTHNPVGQNGMVHLLLDADLTSAEMCSSVKS